MKKPTTKQRIIEVGARLMHEKGYNDTGIQEVLNIAGVPKGSFYFYFKSKEEFGLQVLDSFFEHFKAATAPYFLDENQAHANRVKNFLEEFLEFFVNGEYMGGCPIGNFTLEMADINQKFRAKLKEITMNSTQLIALQIKLAQEKGEIENEEDATSLAEFIFFTWEGMIMQMKIDQDIMALERFKKYIFEHFLKPKIS